MRCLVIGSLADKDNYTVKFNQIMFTVDLWHNKMMSTISSDRSPFLTLLSSFRERVVYEMMIFILCLRIWIYDSLIRGSNIMLALERRFTSSDFCYGIIVCFVKKIPKKEQKYEEHQNKCYKVNLFWLYRRGSYIRR